MPLNAARRRLATFLRTYAIALSFNVLSIHLDTSFFQNGSLLAGASSVLPAKPEQARTSVAGALSRDVLPFSAARGSDRVPSQPDATAPEEAVNTAGARKQPLSEWTHGTEISEGSSDGKQPLRLPAAASRVAPWSVIGTVLPAYLLVLEHELRAALKKLSPVRWKTVSNIALGAEPRFWSLARNAREFGQEAGAFDSTGYPFLRAAGKFPGNQGPVGLSGSVFDGLVENAAQLWQGFLALAQANGYVSAGLPPTEKTVQQISSAPVREHGYLSVAPSDHLLVGRAKKTVQQIVKDITALTTVQQLVSDFARRLSYSLQAEQELKERIGCLADAHSDKHVEGRTGSQPAEDRCARFEKPQSDEDRRALRQALEKQLNDVQQAAKDAAQLLFSILSTPEFDIPFERHNISRTLYEQTSPLVAVASPLFEQMQELPYVETLTDEQAADSVSEKAVSQTLSHSSQSQPHKAGSPGLAPRSLASAPALRGHTLFAKDMQPRASYPPVPFAPSPRRASASPYYGPRQAYQCFKRTPDGQQNNNILSCECRQPEVMQEATVLEPVVCAKVRRSTSLKHRLPVSEQTLECFPSAVDASYVHSVPRASVEYAAVPARPPLPAVEPPLQCQCYKPRGHYECRRSPQRMYVQKEPVRVVPEVVEHRVIEPVPAPAEFEVAPRHELYVPPAAPVPETVLVPCECIEQSVPVAESYAARQETDVYPAGLRESVLIPVECIMRSPQPERVPCECIARQVVSDYARTPLECGPYVECVCAKDDYGTYSTHAYHAYDAAE